jgi:hypothetical protein
MDQPPNELFDPISLLLQALQAAQRATDAPPRQATETDVAHALRQWLAAMSGPGVGFSTSSPISDWWARLLHTPAGAGDATSYWVRWYEAHSGPLAAALDEVLRAPAFVQASARALDDYATAVATQRRTTEAAARGLPFATHADIARLARMLVELESKIERLAEQDQLDAHRLAPRETDDLGNEIAALAGRLDRIEAKVDRLVAPLTDTAPPPRAARQSKASARGPQAADVTVPASTSRKRAAARPRQVRLVGRAPER